MGALIMLANVPIRQDGKGRYCLNDLHRAAGAARKHGPSLWLENQQTQALVAELAAEPDTGIPVSVVKGGPKQGTYACKELVYAYAMWISAAFNLKVIRTFDRAAAGAIDWRKERSRAASTTKVANDILQMVRAEGGKRTESHHYSNEARLVNWALGGAFKALDRDGLAAGELALLAHLEERNAVLIGRGLTYDQRKPILKQYAMDFRMAHALIGNGTKPERQEV